MFPEGLAYEDVPFHVKTMLYAEKISFEPEFLYFYRYNPNSIINTSSNGRDIFKICNLVESFLITNNFYDEFIEEFKLFKITQIFNYLLTTNTEEYFSMAKKEFSEMSLNENNIVPKPLKNKFDLILKSESLEQYKIYEKSSQIKKIKTKNTKNKLNFKGYILIRQYINRIFRKI